MRIVLFHTHIHSIAIGAVNVRQNTQAPSTYNTNHGWRTRFETKIPGQPGSEIVVIYGRGIHREPEKFELYAWHVPNTYDMHLTYRLQKTLHGNFQLFDDGIELVQEALHQNKNWKLVDDWDDFPPIIGPLLQKFFSRICNNFGTGELAFKINNTGAI